ncbi:putative amidohydrolase [Kineococcus xinjiangensis]|uniref:Putative amidohydrolase n=1 Tax=Kineococcus xinjiangensis TaxID=512762 RepID=A0A2S6IFW2_9ACTN|nr:carbon-nitrogen hydrolase family protein [Kineococcus xinjiangensis]PPK93093.1 putative amidohydrolase [Kineococcus xinjiangensis]
MRIALAQIASTPDPAANLELLRDAVTAAAARGARLVVLPEATMCCFGVPLRPVAEPLDGPWAQAVRDIATEHGVTVVAGMFTPADADRVRNTLLVTGGGVEAHYDKVHLFDAFGFQESRTVAPGFDPVLVEVDGVPVGLTTCYDVRFPGLFQALADRGALISVVAASWGAGPGKVEQWEVLARARALDSTTFVVACGQADPATTGAPERGGAPTGVGNSLVVSPLGEVRARLGEGPDLLVVDVDLDEVTSARAVVPVLANRRF